jgi:hypothetical protein
MSLVRAAMASGYGRSHAILNLRCVALTEALGLSSDAEPRALLKSQEAVRVADRWLDDLAPEKRAALEAEAVELTRPATEEIAATALYAAAKIGEPAAALDPGTVALIAAGQT